YYAHCYGIRVLDKIEVHDFFKSLNAAMPEAEKRCDQSISNIRKVVCGSHRFNKEYLKIENTFFEIVSSLAAIGVSINNASAVKALGDVIEAKIKLTHENGAWVQYEHLARWLAYLGSIL